MQMLIIFFMQYLVRVSLTSRSLSIFKNVEDSLSKTPSALIERLMNSTDLKCFFCSLITSMYLSCLRLLLFLRLVSYPTVNSIIYKQLSFVVSMGGRYHQKYNACGMNRHKVK